MKRGDISTSQLTPAATCGSIDSSHVAAIAWAWTGDPTKLCHWISSLLAVLNQVEDHISDTPTSREKKRWTVFHSFSVVAYVISLRGTEGFLLDINGLRRHHQPTDSDHVIIALLGKIKGEHHDLAHLVLCVPKTGSWIDVKRLLERLVNLKESQGFKDGPAISDVSGQLYGTRDIDDCCQQEVLEDLYATQHELFPNHILDGKMIRERYQAFRTYRKSSDS
jgi:hypothetical protein